MTTFPMTFPTDTERIRQDVAEVRGWTPEKRLLAMKQLLSAVTSFEKSSATRQHDRLHEIEEDQWQRAMSELIQRHQI